MILQVKRSLFRPARTATDSVLGLLMCNDFVRLRLCNTHDTRTLLYYSIHFIRVVSLHYFHLFLFMIERVPVFWCIIVQFKLRLWGHRTTFVKVEHIANNHVANLLKYLWFWRPNVVDTFVLYCYLKASWTSIFCYSTGGLCGI